jgi:hypothetical protein
MYPITPNQNGTNASISTGQNSPLHYANSDNQRINTVNGSEIPFKRYSNLKRKIYKCETCDVEFVYKKSIKDHENNIHKKIRKYVCTICNRSCYYKSDFRKHCNSQYHKKNIAIHSQDSIEPPIKKEKPDYSPSTIVATTSNFSGVSQNNQTQEIHKCQAIQDHLMAKRKPDTSSLTVEDASSNSDSTNAVSSTLLADYGRIKSLEYMYLVDTKQRKPNFFEDYFWDRQTRSLVEKDPDFV